MERIKIEKKNVSSSLESSEFSSRLNRYADQLKKVDGENKFGDPLMKLLVTYSLLDYYCNILDIKYDFDKIDGKSDFFNRQKEKFNIQKNNLIDYLYVYINSRKIGGINLKNFNLDLTDIFSASGPLKISLADIRNQYGLPDKKKRLPFLDNVIFVNDFKKSTITVELKVTPQNREDLICFLSHPMPLMKKGRLDFFNNKNLLTHLPKTPQEKSTLSS